MLSPRALCGAAYGRERAAEGVTFAAGEVGAGEEGLPSGAALPCGERCLMLVGYRTRLIVAVPQGRAPREEAEVTGRTVDGVCPKRLPMLML